MEVTSTITRADEKAATPLPAAVDYRSAFSHWLAGIAASGTGQVSGHAARVERPYVVSAVVVRWVPATGSVRQQLWRALLMSPCQGSAGIISVSSKYGPLLPHVGSSSLIVDRRSVKHTPRMTNARFSADGVQALPVAAQLKELQAALSLNKSQLARILRVTRPTLYEWYQGKEPNATNSERIRNLLRVLVRVTVSGARPLNARFIRRPMDADEPSLLDLLCGDPLDEELVVGALERARDLGVAATRSRATREDRLRALGFEDPDRERRREQLASNVALQDWPKQ